MCAFLFHGAVFPRLHQHNDHWSFDLSEPAAPLTNTSSHFASKGFGLGKLFSDISHFKCQ